MSLYSQLPPEHQYMTTTEIAQTTGKSVKTIQNWRRYEDIPNTGKGWGARHSERPFSYRTVKKFTYQKITDRDIWDNYTWLNFMYHDADLGILVLSQITGRSCFYLSRRMKQYGIKRKSHEVACAPKNPYYTREWVDEKYNIEGCTIWQCAKLAGVNPYTIYNWLVKFGYEIRDQYECRAGERNRRYGIPCIPQTRSEKVDAPPLGQSSSQDS